MVCVPVLRGWRTVPVAAHRSATAASQRVCRCPDTFSHSAAPCSSRCQKHCLCFLFPFPMRDTGECFLILYSCFFGFIPRRPKRKPKIHIKSPAGSMSTGVIFILGKGVTPILAYGVKSTWPQGSSAPGFSIFEEHRILYYFPILHFACRNNNQSWKYHNQHLK